MTSMMLAGSRHIAALESETRRYLREACEANAWFLVGDAAGADSAFQGELRSLNHTRVVVFTALPTARTNIGNWSVRVIDSGLKSRGADMHTAKDRKMVELADSGLMLWDAKSPGTLANVIDFVEQGKECTVMNIADQTFSRVDSPKDLEALKSLYPDVYRESSSRLRRFQKRNLVAVPSVEEPFENHQQSLFG